MTVNFSTDELFLKKLFSNDVFIGSRVETLGNKADNSFSLDEQFLKILVEALSKDGELLSIVESLCIKFLLGNFSTDKVFIEDLSRIESL